MIGIRIINLVARSRVVHHPTLINRNSRTDVIITNVKRRQHLGSNSRPFKLRVSIHSIFLLIGSISILRSTSHNSTNLANWITSNILRIRNNSICSIMIRRRRYIILPTVIISNIKHRTLQDTRLKPSSKTINLGFTSIKEHCLS